jgi:hypothetical protein
VNVELSDEAHPVFFEVLAVDEARGRTAGSRDRAVVHHGAIRFSC